MKVKILILLCFTLLAENAYGQQAVDPFQGLKDFADKIDAGARALVQGIKDDFKPMEKALRKADKKVFGGLNKAIFNIDKGIIEGLDEVVGIPATVDAVNFYLVTSKNVNDPVKIDYYDPGSVATSRGKIFFIIHGWMSSRNNSWYPPLTEIFLRKYPHSHVILIDWEKPAADEYPFSAFKTESVGNLVGVFINRLISEFNVPVENFVLIGHSLGGQICGWVGKKVKELSSKKLPKIVALDPAGPLFTFRPNSRRLNKHDADVVMVIHSDGGKLGFPHSCGTIDFYPNGGSNQPGCAKTDPNDINTIFNPLSCNHFRAYEYFIEAVNSTGLFRGRKCASYTFFSQNRNCQDIEANLGDLDEDATGSFYLETAAASPFSLKLKPLFVYVDIVNNAATGGVQGNLLPGDQIVNANELQEGDVIIEVKDD